MDSDLQRELRLGLDCLQGNPHLEDYITAFKGEHPDEAAAIDRISDCYARTQDAPGCFNQVLTGQGSSPSAVAVPEPSGEMRFFCEQVERLGGQAVHEHWDRYRFGREVQKTLFWSESFMWRFSPDDRRTLSSLVTFYAGLLDGGLLEPVRALLQSRPEWRERLGVYGRESVSPISPAPRICPNAAEWDREDLAVEGFPAPIPLFFPRGVDSPSLFYREMLIAGFEILKIFVSPDELRKILHPGGGVPDLAVYIRSSSYYFHTPYPEFLDSNRVFDACGIQTAETRGQYKSEANRLINLCHFTSNYPNTEPDRPFEPLAGQFLRTFIHEFGHAIDDRLSTPEARGNLFALYRWTYDWVRSHPSESEFVPNFDADRIRIHRNYGVEGGFGEFFPEMVAEYVFYELLGGVPTSGPTLARRELMTEFFAPGGLSWNAFAPDRVEEAFRKVGVAVSLPREGRRRERNLVSDGFSFPVLVGGQRIWGSLESWGFFLNLHFGGQVRSESGIYSGGLALDLGYSPGFNSEGRSFYLADPGVWFQFEYDLGPVDLVLAPRVGVRISSPMTEGNPSPFLGTYAGIGDPGGRYSVGIIGKVSAGGPSASLGLGVQINWPFRPK